MNTSQDKPDTLDTPSLEADSEKSGRPGTQAGDLEMTRVDVQPTTRGSAPLGTRKEKTTKEEESDSARKKQNGRDSHSPHEDGGKIMLDYVVAAFAEVVVDPVVVIILF